MFCEIYDTDIERHAPSREVAEVLELYRGLDRGAGVPARLLLDMIGARHGASVNVMEDLGGDDYRFLRFGAAVAALTGHDRTGQRVSDMNRTLAGHLKRIYARARDGGRPVFSIHRAVQARYVHLWERLVLPCVAEDGSRRFVDFIRPRENRTDILDAVLEASGDGIMSLRAVRGPDGRPQDAVVLTVNRRAAEYLGASPSRLIDRKARAALPSLFPPTAWERCLRVMERDTTERFEMGCTLKGLDTLLRVAVTPLPDGFVMSFTDITDLRYALIEMQMRKEEAEQTREDLASEVAARRMVEGELRRIAVTDGLTGVLNRRGFEETVQKETASARRYAYPLSVVAVDIDHFKRVNDLHGHAAGDTVLMTVAAMFQEELRSDTDVIGRVGGEEFMILLPHTPASGAAVLAERLRRRLMELAIRVPDGALTVTASFGVRQLGQEGNAEQMMIAADDALYRAKRSGRNAVVVDEADPSEASPPGSRAA